MINFDRLKKIQQSKAKEPEVDEKPKQKTRNVASFVEKRKQQAIATVEAETARILSLPIHTGLAPETYELVNSHCVRPSELAKPDGFRLFPIQAEGFMAYAQFSGAFCPITVGGGKTLTSLLIPNEAYCYEGIKKSMLIIPPNLVDQLRENDLPFYRSVCHLNLPVHFIPGLPARKRMTKAKSGAKGLYIMTFSLLSSPTGAEILEAIAPELIIVDEAHNLSSSKISARSRRYNEYIKENAPRQVVLSGTMTKNKPMDYYSLVRHSLKEYSFLPTIATMAQTWSDAIGSEASGFDNADRSRNAQAARPLIPLINWARGHFKEDHFDLTLSGFRKAFRYRLCSCPGVVSSGEDHLDVGIKIINDPNPKKELVEGWDKMQSLIEQVKEEWETPSGEIIEHGMHLYKWLYEIEGAGFYNELYWPDTDWIERHRRKKGAEADELLERSKEYLELHQDYSRKLRTFLTDRPSTGLDTPMLVGLDMSKNGPENVGCDLYDAWTDMKDADFKGRLERLKRAIRVCPFKVDQAVEYVKGLPRGEGSLLWFHSAEVGRWLMDQLREADLNPLYCPAGPRYNSEILKKEHFSRPVVASISAHGTGKNLQHFGFQRYVQWPRDAKLAEQSLGRIHRNGQKRKKVFMYTDIASEFDQVVFAKTLNDAAYIHQTMGNKQRLMYAQYDPMPRIIPYEVHKQWGSGARILDDESLEFLEGKFK